MITKKIKKGCRDYTLRILIWIMGVLFKNFRAFFREALDDSYEFLVDIFEWKLGGLLVL